MKGAMWLRKGPLARVANKVTLSTRECLLAAAEEIIVFRGVNALSVRKIGDAAGLNPTLVTYHFGSLLDLLDELCSLNLDPILSDWQQVDANPAGSRSLDEVLHSWLGPMLRPSCFTPGGRALVVLDELAAHGETALLRWFGGKRYPATLRLLADSD